MTDYRIECVQTITDETEIARRLARCYDLLLRCAAKKRAAVGNNPGREAPTATIPTPATVPPEAGNVKVE